MHTRVARFCAVLTLPLAACGTTSPLDAGLGDVPVDAQPPHDVPPDVSTHLDATELDIDAPGTRDGGGSCGDGVLDSGERCDPGIAAGTGSCPTTCDDADPCTVDGIEGLACDAHCVVAPALEGDLDACCPSGATSATDPDCSAPCTPVVGPEFLLRPGARTSHARVHFNGSVYGVLVAETASTGEVFLSTFDRSGTIVLGPIMVSEPHPTETTGAYAGVDITWDGSAWGIVMVRHSYRADRSVHDAVLLRTVAADGTLGLLLDADIAFPRGATSISAPLLLHHPTAGFAVVSTDSIRGAVSQYFQSLGLSGGSPAPPIDLGTRFDVVSPTSWVLAPDGTFGLLGIERSQLWFATMGTDGTFLSGPTLYGGVGDLHAHASLAHDGRDWVALAEHYRATPTPETTFEALRGPLLAGRTVLSTYAGMDTSHWYGTVTQVAESELIAVNLHRPTSATTVFRPMLSRLDVGTTSPAAPNLISTGDFVGTTTTARNLDLAAGGDGQAMLVWTDTRRGTSFLDTYGQLITYACP